MRNLIAVTWSTFEHRLAHRRQRYGIWSLEFQTFSTFKRFIENWLRHSIVDTA